MDRVVYATGWKEYYLCRTWRCTKAEDKYLEQRIMVLNGRAKSTNSLTNLLNKIRSYSPNNPNASTYDIAGYNSDWGGKVLEDALSILKGNGL